jgi:NADH dehydrogenase
VVVVGGGAGGLPLASALARRHRRRGDVRVTLVDALPTHVWKPLLHEVAAGRMDADLHEVDYPALGYRHGFTFQQGRMIGLDRAHRYARVDAVHDEDGEAILPVRELAYDMLVVAVGSESNDFGIPGVAEHAMPIDTPGDAERFHRKLLAASMRANAAKTAGESAAVSIVIIGAGATGVELAAEIRQTTKMHAAYGLDRLDPQRDIRITILEGAPRILPPLSESVAAAATTLLDRLAVDVRVSRKVTAVTAQAVHVGDEVIPADLVVWAAGIRAPEWLAGLDGLETNRSHQLVVHTTLQATRDPDVFAFGDCAACPWPEAPREGAILPPRAQVAYQQAMMLVRTVEARVAGRPLPVFRFRDYGSLVSFGELSAVGTLMGRLIGRNLFVQGLFARLMYASLYKRHQLALGGWVTVALDTLSRFLRGRVEPRVKLH